MDPRFEEFRKLIADLSPESSSDFKQAVFEFIQTAWDAVGEHPEIREEVCGKLKISHALFNSFVLNPPSVRGIENLHRVLRGGWLREYLDYNLGNEAPEEFHLWVGLTILGAALKRHVYIDESYYRIYPNLFTILVAPPGLCKKTTAASIGEGIARESGVIRILSEKITPEALSRALSRPEKEGGKIEIKSQGLLYAPELTVFLGREKYNEPLILLLTRLYDSPEKWEYESIKHDKIPLREVFISLLGCTTPTELSQAIPSSSEGGGLMSRLVIIYKTHSPRCFPVPVMDDPTRRDLLVAQLKRLAETVRGQFVVSPEAQEWWKSYYVKWKALAERGGEVSEREPYMIKKIAMLLAVSEGRDFLLDVDLLSRSRVIVASAYSTWQEMTATVSSTERAKFHTLVYETIRRNGGVMGRSALTKKLYGKMKGADVEDAINFLKAADMIREFKKDLNTFYRVTSLKEREDA
ncbi:MAG: hypothetical protein QXR28_02275 [Nitrososphaerota archaeon]